MLLKVGNTFFMANTGGSANPAGAHLMICLIAGTPENNAIIVPLVSRHDLSDTSCVLHVGDHPFIRHESCIAYDFARVISMADLAADIAAGEIVLQKSVSKAVLLRAQIGFINSPEVEPRVFTAAHGDRLELFLKSRGHI